MLRYMIFLILIGRIFLPSALGMTVTEMFSADQFQIKSENGIETIAWPGSSPNIVFGTYRLPSINRTFILPSDHKISNISFQVIDSTILEGFHYIAINSDTAERTTLPLDYFTKTVSLAYEGYQEGNHLAVLSFRPLHLESATGRLVLYQEIEVRLETDAPAGEFIARKKVFPGYGTEMQNELQKIVANPADINLFANIPVESKVTPNLSLAMEIPSNVDTLVPYLIITVDTLKSSFNAFAKWKAQFGINAAIRTVSWIESNFPGGADTQDRIRRFIKHAYANWGTKWVLLGGDNSLIPARKVWISDLGGLERLSDYYYACLDGEWNANRNHYYGEIDDSCDLIPEIGVGRAPVQTPAEAQLFVSKVMNYSMAAQYTDYQDRILLLGSFTFYQGDGAEVCETVAGNMPAGIQKDKLYEFNTDGSEGNLSKAGAISYMNQGYNLVFGTSHSCNPSCWVMVDGPGHTRQDFGNSDADALSNAGRYGIYYNIACDLSDFNYDHITRHLILSPSGGAAASIASSAHDNPFATDIMAGSFVTHCYTDDDNALGKALNLAKQSIIGDAFYDGSRRDAIIYYTLMGDPEMQVWTDNPQVMTISLNPSDLTLDANYSSIVATVQASGSPVQGAEVILQYDSTIYLLDTTDSYGQVDFGQSSWTFGHVGPIYCSAVKSGYRPVADTIFIGPLEDKAGLNISELAVDDDSTGGTLGNNNGRIEAGERIGLLVTVQNQSFAAATNCFVKISSGDTSQIRVISDSVYIGTVISGGWAVASANLVLEVDAALADQKVFGKLNFLLGKTGVDYSEDHQILINAPVLRKDAHVIDDDNLGFSDGNGNGIIESGEIIELPINLRNDGFGDIDGISAVLSSTDPNLSFFSLVDSVYYGEILAKSVKNNSSPFVFSYNGTPGSSIPFHLVIQDGFNRQTSIPFSIKAVSPVSRLTYLPFYDAIDIMWDSVASSDHFGFLVYRGTTPGNLNRVVSEPIEAASHYLDKGLNIDQTYYYRISMLDSSGNESVMSQLLTAATNPSVDPDFPGSIPQTFPWEVSVADLDNNGSGEILFSKGNTVYAYNSDGTSYINGANGALFSVQGADFIYTSPAVADINGDGYKEVVIADAAGTNYQIHCRKIYGQQVLGVSGWPKNLGGTAKAFFTAPVLADLNNDGLHEVILNTDDGKIHVWKNDGSGFLQSGDVFYNSGVTGSSMTSPAVGDINGDGVLDIIYTSKDSKLYAFNQSGQVLNNFPVTLESGNYQLSDPIIGEFDGAFTGQEIAVQGGQKHIHLIRGDGSEPAAWPFARSGVNKPFYSQPAAASGDINHDGVMELIATLNDRIYAIDLSGQCLAGWPKQISNLASVERSSTPLVADVDGNDTADVVAVFGNRDIYAFDKDGLQISGFPISAKGGALTLGRTADSSSVRCVSVSDSLWSWELGEYNPGLLYSDQINHDAHHSGNSWGHEPVSSAISISPTPVYTSQSKTVSITVTDPDAAIGDQITFSWSAVRGSIVNQNSNTTNYSAPGSAGNDTIRVLFYDKAGNSTKKSIVFYVNSSGGGGGGSCPFLTVWDGHGYVEENTILTQSEYSPKGSPVVDYYMLQQAPVPIEDRYRIRIEERQNEISYIDEVKLLKVPARNGISALVTPEGQIFYPEMKIEPVRAYDSKGSDVLSQIKNKDNVIFKADGSGWLIVDYDMPAGSDNEGYLNYFGAMKDYCPPPIQRKLNANDSGSYTGTSLPAIPSRLELSYKTVDGDWIKLADCPSRDYTADMFSTINLPTEGNPIQIKYEWTNGWKVDQLPLIIPAKIEPIVNPLSPSKGHHSINGEVTRLINTSDNDFAVLRKGESLELTLPIPPGEPSDSGDSYIVYARGYYVVSDEETANVPLVFALNPNFPNPFNASTRIDFTIPNQSMVELKIFNINGQAVRTLVCKVMSAGMHSVIWDGKDNFGRETASGIYLYRIKAGDLTAIRKMTLLK
ncbi:hypothetical protein TRIP_C20089 [Candidatus Zixiibacteriota bacterium]|nr:hypothetical protein TRIP_C20089 [candidate division Zixibacteria bacterium]